MANFTGKCPNCNSVIEYSSTDEVIKCPGCRQKISIHELTKDYFSNQNYEKIAKAVEYRNDLEFEDAIEILESLLSTNPDNAELYYQLLLCDYGISFVKENIGAQEKPILNLIHENPMRKNHYYKKLMETLKGNPGGQAFYEAKIEQFEQIRLKAIELMKQEEPYDIFLSYKRMAEDGVNHTPDSDVARRLYERFKKMGYRVFFAEEVLHREHSGEMFEPIIYSALMSAKIFILVCASEDKEYLISPWVKSEWMRFKKRVETVDPGEKVLLLPVLANNFPLSRLPKQIREFEGLPLNEEFYDIVGPRFKQIISTGRSQFKNVELDTSIKKLKTNTEQINIVSFQGYKEQALTYGDKAVFDAAISQMEANTDKCYKEAYRALSGLTATNSRNFEANLAKLKCDLKITYNTSFDKANIVGKDLEKINQDYILTIEVASHDQALDLANSFVTLFHSLLLKAPKDFASIISDKIDFFLTIMSSFKDNDLLISKIKDVLEPAFKDIIRMKFNAEKAYDYARLKDGQVETILLKTFKRFYSNYDVKGARYIVSLYNYIANLYLDDKQLKFADRLYNVVLSIDEYNSNALYKSFIINTSGSDNLTDLCNSLTEDNFDTFDLEGGIPEREGYEADIYYLIVKLISGGERFDFTNKQNVFRRLFDLSLMLVNYPKKIELARKIIKTLIEMSRSAKITDGDYISLLLKSGNRFLIEEDYDEARKYFEEALSNDEENLDARWGLLKCEAKCPTNYALLFYKGNIYELTAYSRLMDVVYAEQAKNPEMGEPVYLTYYKALNNIKNGKSNNKKIIYKAFKNKNQELLDASMPEDDTLENILASLNTGSILSTNAKVKKAPKIKTPKVKKSSYSYKAKSDNSVVGIISYILMPIIMFAIPMFFTPMIAIVGFVIYQIIMMILRYILKKEVPIGVSVTFSALALPAFIFGIIMGRMVLNPYFVFNDAGNNITVNVYSILTLVACSISLIPNTIKRCKAIADDESPARLFWHAIVSYLPVLLGFSLLFFFKNDVSGVYQLWDSSQGLRIVCFINMCAAAGFPHLANKIID